MSLAELSPSQKEELAVSLSALLLQDAGVDITAENLTGVLEASGNKVAAFWPTLFASYIEKVEGIEKFLAAPGGGGGGGGASAGGGGGAEAPAAGKKEEKKEEEEEVDLGAGNMFGGGGDGY